MYYQQEWLFLRYDAFIHKIESNAPVAYLVLDIL